MKRTEDTADEVLIDSSAWIATITGRGPTELHDDVEHCLQMDRAVATGMVVLEVLRGAASATAFGELESAFTSLGRLQVDEFTWHEAARLGWELRRKGLSVPAADLLIATTAILNECTLLHCDRHFEMIAEHAPLKTWSPAA